MKFIPTALALALVSGSTFANESWFEIELILFERHSEETAQVPHRQPRDFIKHTAIDLVTAQLSPSYVACPVLSQRQRFDLAKAQQATLTQPAPQPEVMTDLEQLSQPVICQAPDESILSQAYTIRAQRLTEQATLNQSNMPTPSNTLPQDLSTNGESLFDAGAFVAYPSLFTIDEQAYTAATPQAAAPINSVPITLVSDELATERDAPHLLPLDKLQMVELRKKMRWQKSLTPILHTGWRQPVYARHLAQRYHLFGGSNYATRFNADGSEYIPVSEPMLAPPNLDIDEPMLIPPQPSLPSVSLEDIVAELSAEVTTPRSPLWQLDGSLKIYLNRFLFIESDFDLRKPGTVSVVPEHPTLDGADFDPLAITPAGSISLVKQVEPVELPAQMDQASLIEVPWLNSSQLTQHRRVRSKEIHYFDHPNFGMVIQIRRFKLESDEE